MRKIIAALLCSSSFLVASPGDLVSYTKIAKLSDKDVEGLARQYSIKEFTGSGGASVVYKITYETTDPRGVQSVASGAIVVPDKMENLDLLCYLHGTVCTRDHVPSKLNFHLYSAIAAFGTGGYVIAAPDYLGLGESEFVTHPFCHKESLASASKDMITATMGLCQKLDVKVRSELYITGYSEGGMAAMALHDALQKSPLPGIKIKASAPMSGPYDLSGSMMRSSLSEPNPRASCYLTYLVLAYDFIYPSLFSSLNNVFLSHIASMLPVLFDGTQSMMVIQKLLPQEPKALVKEAFLNNLINDKKAPLTLRLAENNTYQWVSEAPIALIALQSDQDVPFANAQMAYDYMKSKGAKQVSLIDVGSSYDHLTGRMPCHVEARKFFDGVKVSRN